jgi:hypothetical protein
VTVSKIFVTLTWENMKSQVMLPVIPKIIDANHYLFLYAFPSTPYRRVAVICLYRGDVDLVAYTVVLGVFSFSFDEVYVPQLIQFGWMQ